MTGSSTPAGRLPRTRATASLVSCNAFWVGFKIAGDSLLTTSLNGWEIGCPLEWSYSSDFPLGTRVTKTPNLLTLERGETKEILRVFHYGDSHTAADEWSGTLRYLLQARELKAKVFGAHSVEYATTVWYLAVCHEDMEALDEAAPLDLDGADVLMIGAGGAARAIAFALAARGARLRVANRTADKAAGRLDVQASRAAGPGWPPLGVAAPPPPDGRPPPGPAPRPSI